MSNAGQRSTLPTPAARRSLFPATTPANSTPATQRPAPPIPTNPTPSNTTPQGANNNTQSTGLDRFSFNPPPEPPATRSNNQSAPPTNRPAPQANRYQSRRALTRAQPVGSSNVSGANSNSDTQRLHNTYIVILGTIVLVIILISFQSISAIAKGVTIGAIMLFPFVLYFFKLI